MISRYVLIAAFALLATTARAETNVTTTTSPVPLDVHVCHNFPHSAAWTGTEGESTVSFHIAADGTVKDLSITQSSGDRDLDQAALTCASLWRYKPATHDSVAVEVPWTAQIHWSTHPPIHSPCTRYASVTPEMLAGISGESEISFHIQQGGFVSDTVIMRSSGNTNLDQAALQCVSNMRFDLSRAHLPSTGIEQHLAVNWKADLPHQEAKAVEKSAVDPLAANLPAGTTPPALIQSSMCGKPAEAVSGVTGPTEVSFKIGTDGTVRSIAVKKSSGNQVLDNVTATCIANWKYAPAKKDGKPVEVDWSEHINWQSH